VLSVTQSKYRVGHAGIVSDNNRIMSNNSRTSKWEENYTLWTWKWRYNRLLGLQTHFYRYKETAHKEQLEKQVISLQKKVVVLLQHLTIKLQEKIMSYKYLGSSANPKKIALTVKGAGVWLIPALIFIAGYFGLNVVEADLVKLLDEISRIVGSVMVAYGLVRKIYYALNPTE